MNLNLFSMLVLIIFGIILDSFWVHVGLILSSFWVHVGVSGGRGVPPKGLLEVIGSTWP